MIFCDGILFIEVIVEYKTAECSSNSKLENAVCFLFLFVI